MRALIVCCALCVVGTQGASGYQPQQLDFVIDSAVNESQGTAPAALDTLRKLVHSGNYAAMGFNSLGEVNSATLGAPLVVFHVRRDKLLAFKPSDDPVGLLSGGDRVLYPVLVQAQTRSAVTVGRAPGGWRPVSYGGASAAKLASDVVRNAVSTLGLGQRRYFWVDVLPLSTNFIGFEDGGKLILIPFVADPHGRWPAGVPLPAAKVFAQLAGDAKAYGGLPR
jgi:hypothetical protein